MAAPFQDMLYRFALDCAEHKQNNDCNRQCRTCPSNITAYGIDARTAVMYQHTAELETGHNLKLKQRALEYHNGIQRNRRTFSLMSLLTPIFVIVITLIIISANRDKPIETEVVQQPAVVVQPVAIKPAVTKPAVDTLEPIRQTLRKVYGVDMSGDGKITCIDYAIQFWNYYPDQFKVRVIWNYNPSGNFNHLFVNVNGIMIEPAAYLLYDTPEHWFSISKVWKVRYNPAFDVDVTEHMDRIKVDQYWRE
jgi:hypothetical protein